MPDRIKFGELSCMRMCAAKLRKHGFALISLVSVSFAPSQACAVTNGVTFQGTIDTPATCSITVRQNGRFGVSADYKTLSSKIAGGLDGIADVLAFGTYNVSATTFPTFTASPTGGTTGTSIQSFFSGTSLLLGLNFAERPGTNPIALPSGLSYTRISTHLVATRTGSAFPTGYYQGIVVVRCE